VKDSLDEAEAPHRNFNGDAEMKKRDCEAFIDPPVI
jgi:hypothetical protein